MPQQQQQMPRTSCDLWVLRRQLNELLAIPSSTVYDTALQCDTHFVPIVHRVFRLTHFALNCPLYRSTYYIILEMLTRLSNLSRDHFIFN